jgi:hypothetical protein
LKTRIPFYLLAGGAEGALTMAAPSLLQESKGDRMFLLGAQENDALYLHDWIYTVEMIEMLFFGHDQN